MPTPLLMVRSPKDDKIFHKIGSIQENIVTLGRATTIHDIEMGTCWGGRQNFLIGRFSQLAGGFILINGDHSIKTVTTSPLDVDLVVKQIFGKIRPNLQPLSG